MIKIYQKKYLLCPQTMFKFHPDFDHLLAKILEKDKKGILYLIKDSNKIYYQKLINRFKKIKNFDLDRVTLLIHKNEMTISIIWEPRRFC